MAIATRKLNEIIARAARIALYLSHQQPGDPMNATEVKAWRADMHWSQPEAAQALGVALRTYQYWEALGASQIAYYAMLWVAHSTRQHP